jgi:diguanylate cyclase
MLTSGDDPVSSQSLELVERISRLVMSRTSALAGLVALIQSGLFWYVGDSMWRWTLVAVVCNLGLYLMVSRGASYVVFMLSMFGQFFFAVIYATALTLAYGRDSGFHFTLLAIVPMIMISGRFGTFSKYLITSFLLILTLWLDRSAVAVSSAIFDSSTAIAFMRSLNISIGFLVGGTLLHYFFNLSNAAQRELMDTANVDALTKLANRHRLNEIVTVLMAQSQRHKRPLSLIIADIDTFKSINDQYGHRVGDDVLLGVSQVLKACARDADTVVRWGGEEFILLLPDTNVRGAYISAERIRQKIEHHVVNSDQLKINVTMTLGAAQLTGKETFDRLVDRADAALRKGKAEGRNRVVLASPSNDSPNR